MKSNFAEKLMARIMPRPRLPNPRVTRPMPAKGMAYGQMTAPGMANYPKNYDSKQNAFIPQGIKSVQKQMSPDAIEKFYRDNLPPNLRNNPNYRLEEYYPAAKYFPKMREVEQKMDKDGLAILLALQAFYETTGGRNAYKNNMFGTKPRGVPNGFRDLSESIDYQVSPNVLAGGAVPNMNILKKKGELTPQEIEVLYKSYDPPGAYTQNILKNYKRMRGL